MNQRACIAAMAIVLAGCADPKEANEKNFKAAIQAYLDSVYPKCYFHRNFPTTVEFDVGGTRAALKSLVKAGLVIEKDMAAADSAAHRKAADVKLTYDLTDEGRKYYKAGTEKTFNGNTVGGFCFGKASIKEIGQFTEPSDMFGVRISRVNYTYTVSDLPNWAKSLDESVALRELKAEASSTVEPIKRLDTVVLTNDGWVHEKLFKK